MCFFFFGGGGVDCVLSWFCAIVLSIPIQFCNHLAGVPPTVLSILFKLCLCPSHVLKMCKRCELLAFMGNAYSKYDLAESIQPKLFSKCLMDTCTKLLLYDINYIYAVTRHFQQCCVCDQQSLRSACAYV